MSSDAVLCYVFRFPKATLYSAMDGGEKPVVSCLACKEKTGASFGIVNWLSQVRGPNVRLARLHRMEAIGTEDVRIA